MILLFALDLNETRILEIIIYCKSQFRSKHNPDFCDRFYINKGSYYFIALLLSSLSFPANLYDFLYYRELSIIFKNCPSFSMNGANSFYIFSVGRKSGNLKNPFVLNNIIEVVLLYILKN